MNEASYFAIRAQHYHRLAALANDTRLKGALEAIAVDMSAKVATADSNRHVSGAEPVQEAMDERVETRIRTHRRGWLSRTKGERLQKCIIWDESTAGARLVVDATREIPDTFYIYLSADPESLQLCRVAWRSDTQIGVEFVDSSCAVR
jgi:hypothetical protein